MDHWPFEQPPNTAASTTREILEGKAPVLRVTHDADDGGWQFLPNTAVSPEDARVVGLEHMCGRDPTLFDVADLPEGWVAWRDRPGATWHRERRSVVPAESVSGTVASPANREHREHVTSAEPELHHALIGAGFGLLLIYLGTLVSSRALRWPIVGVGALFVVVMSLYAVVMLRKKVSRHIRPLVGKARGHVRDDARLGRLTRDATAGCWTAMLPRGDRTLNFVIGGDDEPDPQLLAHARDLLARFDALERLVEGYLAGEAEKEGSEHPEMAAEIRALRIESVTFRFPARPGHVVIDFEGPEEMRYWYCDYANGALSGLTFDT